MHKYKKTILSEKTINTVLVTGIGGNVGQGILRNIARIGYPVRTIGTNIEAVSSGNHLADEVYVVPYAYEAGYIPEIRRICGKTKVNLIIPSTDYEAVFLTKNRKILPPVASSAYRVNAIGLDKWRTYQEFTKASLPFAETALPSVYDGRFGECIVKPREGRGSRGVVINPEKPADYPDTYVVQKRYQGIELTTAFYVTRQGKRHSQITFERTLYAGMTSKCSVNNDYNPIIEDIIDSIIKNFPVRASINIQSIATADGKVIPFEINTRISGTNSVRGHLGFDDVRWTLSEYLYGEVPEKAVIKNGAAHRIIMDVIYPDISIGEIRNRNTKHYIF